tara:strand:- start:464 stop:2290 length:1827 start_codon:yes stop_codon:yes gene_type:complete
MSDINKYTTKEVLNKVLLDSSGDAVAAFSHTSQEAFNAALDDANSRLNVSLVGGTIGGDVTITGDLTVNGSAEGTYDEIFNGNLIVNHNAAEIAGFKRTNGSNDSAQARIAIGNDTKTAYLGLDGDEKFHIGFTQNLTNNTAFVIDDANNNIGIGTDSPDHKLKVEESTNGADCTIAIRALNDGGAGRTALLKVDPDAQTLTLGVANIVTDINNSLVGIGTASPSSYNNYAHNLVVYEAGHAGITIATNGANHCSIYFADGTSGAEAYAGYLDYNHNTNVFDFGVAGLSRMKLDANSRISLSNNDGGSFNTVFGKLAGDDLTSGGNANSFFGENAGHGNSTGTDNVAIGVNALKSCPDSDQNVVVGSEAMKNLDGSANTLKDVVAIGYRAFFGTGGTNSAPSGTVAIGSNALLALTSGASNTAVGFQAGDVIVTGSENTILGYACDVASDDNTNNIIIGNNLTGTDKDNAVFIGNDTNHIENDFNADATWNYSSDVRQKTNIEDDTLGLDFINDLRTVTYKHKSPSEFPREWSSYNEDDKEPMGGDKTIHGLIAQEVKEALDKQGVDTFAGWSVGDDGRQRISSEKMVMPLIKAVQELSARVKELESK